MQNSKDRAPGGRTSRRLLLVLFLLASCAGGEVVADPEVRSKQIESPRATTTNMPENSSEASETPASVGETNETPPPPTEVPATPSPYPTATTIPTEIPEPLMPDVMGLSESDAIDVLFSAGIERPETTTKPSLEAAGTVIDQVPSAGTEVIGPARLVLTEPLPPMPDVVGQRVDTVRRNFEELGVTVREERELTTDRPEDEVLRTVPTAGEQIGAEIVAIVATAPSMHDLSTLERLAENPRSGLGKPKADRVSINGEVAENGLWIAGDQYTDAGDYSILEFNLGRDWDLFEANLGLSDYSSSSQAASITIKLDGVEIYSESFSLGESDSVSLGVENGLRLRIEIEALGDGKIYPALGNPRLLGLP